MADELHGISLGTSPQDMPTDHSVTQPLQVNIQVPDTVSAIPECTNFGIFRFCCSIFCFIFMAPFIKLIILPLLDYLDII